MVLKDVMDKKPKNLKWEKMPIWANSGILPFLWWDFSTFFSISCPRSTRMKNRPYWMVKKSPKHWEKSKKWLCYKPDKFTRCLWTPGIFWFNMKLWSGIIILFIQWFSITETLKMKSQVANGNYFLFFCVRNVKTANWKKFRKMTVLNFGDVFR